VKGTAAKRCKLYESQQHNKYYVDHSLKVDGFSAAAEKAAAALNDLYCYWDNRWQLAGTGQRIVSECSFFNAHNCF
jgi:hypothetical protein